MPYNIEEVGEVTTIDQLQPAEYGTIKIILYNLDPMSEDFEDKASKLTHFSNDTLHSADIYVRMSFLCGGATVFNGFEFVNQVGQMQNYDVQDYDSQTTQLGTNTQQIASVQCKISLSLEKKYIEPDRLYAVKLITIHYQANPLTTSSIMDNPLIGTENNIYNAIQGQKTHYLPSYAYLRCCYSHFCS